MYIRFAALICTYFEWEALTLSVSNSSLVVTSQWLEALTLSWLVCWMEWRWYLICHWYLLVLSSLLQTTLSVILYLTLFPHTGPVCVHYSYPCPNNCVCVEGNDTLPGQCILTVHVLRHRLCVIVCCKTVPFFPNAIMDDIELFNSLLDTWSHMVTLPMFPGLSDHWPIRRHNTWLFDRPTNQIPFFILC